MLRLNPRAGKDNTYVDVFREFRENLFYVIMY